MGDNGWQQQQQPRADVGDVARLSSSYPRERGASLAKAMSVDSSGGGTVRTVHHYGQNLSLPCTVNIAGSFYYLNLNTYLIIIFCGYGKYKLCLPELQS